MRMLSIAIIATIGLSTPVLAEKSAETTFEHEGITYVYRAEAKADATLISGHSFPGRKPFRLIVSNGRVRGVSGGTPVSFNTREIKPLAAKTKLSMR